MAITSLSQLRKRLAARLGRHDLPPITPDAPDRYLSPDEMLIRALRDLAIKQRADIRLMLRADLPVPLLVEDAANRIDELTAMPRDIIELVLAARAMTDCSSDVTDADVAVMFDRMESALMPFYGLVP